MLIQMSIDFSAEALAHTHTPRSMFYVIDLSLGYIYYKQSTCYAVLTVDIL